MNLGQIKEKMARIDTEYQRIKHMPQMLLRRIALEKEREAAYCAHRVMATTCSD